VSLFSRNLKLIPLSAFQIHNQLMSNKKLNDCADDENELVEENDGELDTTAYYDIKIKNEINQNLDYKIANSINPSKSYVTIPFDVKKNKTSDSRSTSSMISPYSLLSSSSFHGDQSSKSIESLKSCNLELKAISSFISSSSVISYPLNNEQKQKPKSYTAPLIVEYIPKGEIITVSVSIMW
jgi:hypothetical protein